MAETNISPVLDLTAIKDRQFIRIGGEHYDLRNPAELSLLDQWWAERNYPKLWELLRRISDAAEPDPVEATELERLLKRFVTLALEAPESVLERLTYGQRLDICRAFLRLPTATPSGPAANAAPGTTEASQSTGP